MYKRSVLVALLNTALHCGLFAGPNVTFVLNNNPMSWTQAQNYCREHHTDLASVRNMAENQRVKELVPLGQFVWIGLFRDSWKWSDGSNSSFRYWQTGEPNNQSGDEACVSTNFDSSGVWEDWSCRARKEFICYSKREWSPMI
uniref:C-type lectin domain-containing protein n=1 Tax=Dicentrarchus labrax TaxID=13489 RepID=A0A8C4GGJ3_DICLA